MMDNSKAIKSQLLKKENEIIRGTMLYCSQNGISFDRKHNALMRNALRLFFIQGVAPIMRDIYEDNVKNYTD